jgi:hypothetical protein
MPLRLSFNKFGSGRDFVVTGGFLAGYIPNAAAPVFIPPRAFVENRFDYNPADPWPSLAMT